MTNKIKSNRKILRPPRRTQNDKSKAKDVVFESLTRRGGLRMTTQSRAS